MDLSIKWCLLNIVFLTFFLYFVTQGYILLSREEEILQQDSTVYHGIAYIGIYEILFIFLLFGKIMYLIFLKIDQINYESVKVRIESMEFFCFLPQLIEMFLLLCQIFYFDGYRFTKRDEFLKINDFKHYCFIKKRFGIFYSVRLMLCFLGFSCGFLCHSCNFCACCLEECGLFRNKSRRVNYTRRKKRNGQNRIYAV